MSQFVFKMPDLGEGTVEAEIVAWHTKPGDSVNEDQLIVEVMTDKAAVEVPAPVSGRVVSITGEPGDKIAVGSPLIVFDTAGREAGAGSAADAGLDAAVGRERPGASEGVAAVAAPHGPAASEATAAAVAATIPLEEGGAVRGASGTGAAAAFAAPPLVAARSGRVMASPANRRRAREAGIDLATIAGSGPGGRIVRGDLVRVSARPRVAVGGEVVAETSGERSVAGVGSVAAAADAASTTEIKVIGLRRLIAERMSAAKRNIPHFAYIEEVDITELESLRAHLNSTLPRRTGGGASGAGGREGNADTRTRADGSDGHGGDGGAGIRVGGGVAPPGLTYLPFVVLALTRALQAFPQCNVRYDASREVLVRHRAVHVGVATQTPDGLKVPVVRNAQALSVWDLAAEIRRVAERARSNTATRDELMGSTITVTSLGKLGGIASTPVINAPEVAIIGLNKAVERPVVYQGAVAVRRIMNLSSSFDHRFVDGYDAAAMIQVLKDLLEHPATIFIPQVSIP